MEAGRQAGGPDLHMDGVAVRLKARPADGSAFGVAELGQGLALVRLADPRGEDPPSRASTPTIASCLPEPAYRLPSCPREGPPRMAALRGIVPWLD